MGRREVVIPFGASKARAGIGHGEGTASHMRCAYDGLTRAVPWDNAIDVLVRSAIV